MKDYELNLNQKKRLLIVGHMEEAERVKSVLQKTDIQPEIIGFVNPGHKAPSPFLGSIDQIKDIVNINQVDEIVFCSKDIPSQNIIGIMTLLIGISVDYKIAPPESLSIIGSNSINTAGDLYTIHFNSIGKESNMRNKRLFDVTSSLVIISSFPAWLLIFRKPFNGLKNVILVLLGFKTWVGYCQPEYMDVTTLPALRTGVLTPADMSRRKELSKSSIERLNMMYAKDYKLVNDLLIFLRSLRKLGG
jgi:hypothetical protein